MSVLRAPLCCMLCLAPLAAQPSPQAILARAKAAQGGSAWDGVTSLVSTGTLAAGGLQGTLENLENLRTGANVAHTDLGGHKEASGFDGKTNWTQDGSGYSRPDGSVTGLQSAANGAYLSARAYWFPERWQGKVTYLRGQREGERSFQVLEILPVGGHAFEVWVDEATGLFDRTVETVTGQTTTVFFTDYRAVGGLKLPFAQRITNGEVKYDTLIRLDAVRLDVPAEAARFAMPEPPAADSGLAGASTTLPFEFIHNHIFVKIKLNGKGPFRVFLDTGGANVLTTEAAKALGLEAKGALQGGGAGENSEDFALTKVDKVELGGAWLERQPFYVMGSVGYWTRRKLGVEVDGIVGYEVFRRFVVRVDYDRRELTLYPSRTFTYAGPGVTVPFLFHEQVPEVEGEIDGMPGKFDLDTGSGADLDLFTPFVKAHGLVEKYHAALHRSDNGGVGGDIATYEVRAGELKLGGAVMKAPVVHLSQSKKGAMAYEGAAGNVGEGFFQRFNLVFDYSRQQIHFEPNQGWAAPSDYDKAGLGLVLGKDAWEVEEVLEGSPAAAAGFVKGDQILTVDGKGPQALTLAELWSTCRHAPDGTRLVLKVKGGAGERTVTLVLRRLL